MQHLTPALKKVCFIGMFRDIWGLCWSEKLFSKMCCFLYRSKSICWKVSVGTIQRINVHIILIYIYRLYLYMHVYKNMYMYWINIHSVSFFYTPALFQGEVQPAATCSQAFAAIHTQVKPQVAGRRCLGGWVKLRTPSFLLQGKWRGCNEWFLFMKKNIWSKSQVQVSMYIFVVKECTTSSC